MIHWLVVIWKSERSIVSTVVLGITNFMALPFNRRITFCLFPSSNECQASWYECEFFVTTFPVSKCQSSSNCRAEETKHDTHLDRAIWQEVRERLDRFSKDYLRCIILEFMLYFSSFMSLDVVFSVSLRRYDAKYLSARSRDKLA